MLTFEKHFLYLMLIYSRSQMQCGWVVEKCVQIFIKKRLKMYGVYFTAILKTPQKNQKHQNKYFIKFLRPSEIILLSDALKGIPLSSKWVQCAAVRTIHSLMIDPPQACCHFPSPLKQNEYSYLKILGFGCPAIFFSWIFHPSALWDFEPGIFCETTTHISI